MSNQPTNSGGNRLRNVLGGHLRGAKIPPILDTSQPPSRIARHTGTTKEKNRLLGFALNVLRALLKRKLPESRKDAHRATQINSAVGHGAFENDLEDKLGPPNGPTLTPFGLGLYQSSPSLVPVIASKPPFIISESTAHSAPFDHHHTSGTLTSGSACERVIRHKFSPHELPSLIEAIFSSQDERDLIPRLPRGDAQIFVDVVNEALGRSDLSLRIRRRCLKILYKTCGVHALLPSTLKISVSYDRTNDALYRGGFADVWRGEYCGQEVAVKVLRTYSNSDFQRIIGRFCREVVMWKALQHPNVLPLIGVMMSETRFAMISDWMDNGNINDFVKAHPDADRPGLLVGVARGLIYIHSQGMIHGDLKGANILIDQTGNVRLADFGLLTIVSDPTNLLTSSSYVQGGTARWMGPELIDPQRFGLQSNRPTKASDCYAFGMVIYETISGKPPFHQHGDLTVFTKVLDGERPPRRIGFTDSQWDMLRMCWKPQPSERPNIHDVLLCLATVSTLSDPQSLRLNGESEMDDDDWDLSDDSSITKGGRRNAMTTRLDSCLFPPSVSRAAAPHLQSAGLWGSPVTDWTPPIPEYSGPLRSRSAPTSPQYRYG